MEPPYVNALFHSCLMDAKEVFLRSKMTVYRNMDVDTLSRKTERQGVFINCKISDTPKVIGSEIPGKFYHCIFLNCEIYAGMQADAAKNETVKSLRLPYSYLEGDFIGNVFINTRYSLQSRLPLVDHMRYIMRMHLSHRNDTTRTLDALYYVVEEALWHIARNDICWFSCDPFVRMLDPRVKEILSFLTYQALHERRKLTPTETDPKELLYQMSYLHNIEEHAIRVAKDLGRYEFTGKWPIVSTHEKEVEQKLLSYFMEEESQQ